MSDVSVDLIEAITLKDGGLVALSQVFIDESGTHGGSPCMSIGGFIFKKHNATKFSKQWNAVLRAKGVPYFRMTDVTHPNHGPFHGWSVDDLVRLEKMLIKKIGEFAEFGFAVSVNEAEFDEIFEEDILGYETQKVLGDSYTFCLQSGLAACRSWIARNRFSGKMSYFFEAGHKSQSTANRLISPKAEDIAGIETQYRHDLRYVAHAFVEKNEFPPLQAADLLAWLWRNTTIKSMAGKPERADFTALRNSVPIETKQLSKHDLKNQREVFIRDIRDVDNKRAWFGRKPLFH